MGTFLKSFDKGSRITLNPNAKEVIISSGQEVDTYSFPEIF